MKLPHPIRVHLPLHFWQMATTAGVFLGVIFLIAWTVWFLRREAARAYAQPDHRIEVPILDRALLSAFAARLR